MSHSIDPLSTTAGVLNRAASGDRQHDSCGRSMAESKSRNSSTAVAKSLALPPYCDKEEGLVDYDLPPVHMVRLKSIIDDSAALSEVSGFDSPYHVQTRSIPSGREDD
jgi:hypothetical protein